MTRRFWTALRAQVASVPLLLGCVQGAIAEVAGAAPVPSAANGAPAQGQTSNGPVLEEVLVTATKTGATLIQKTPAAISAFSAAQLDQSGVSNIRDLVEYAPNLALSQNNVNAEIYIRGVGSNNVYTGSDPDVTVQVDGVYIARPSAQFADYLDVERVEILRGPQGTLYGRNAVGGTVNVISRTPSDTFTAREELTAGNYSLVHEQAYISGPLVPNKLQGSLAIDYINHDPYIKNLVASQPGSGDANHGTARVQLRLEPTDHITATTRADFLASRENFQHTSHLLAPYTANHGAPLANSTIGNYFEEALNSPQMVTTHEGGISEDIVANLAADFMLRSITAYRKERYRGALDSDATELSLNTGKELSEDESQFSQELNINGKISIVDWVAGAYYFHENDALVLDATTPTAEKGDFPRVYAQSEAIFAQAAVHVLPDVAVTAGARYTDEIKSFDADVVGHSLASGASLPGLPYISHNRLHDRAVTPKLGVDWQITKDAMLYVSATRGYKSGGFNYAATSPATESFNPEYLWSYEAGVKTEWLANRLRVNLTGFHYDYNDIQVQSLIAPGVSSISNAAGATINGVELETTFKPAQPLELTANLSTLDAKYGSFPSASVPQALRPYLLSSPRYNSTLGTYNATGNTLNDAPHFSGLLAARYTYEMDARESVFGRIEYSFKSRQYFDASNALILSQEGFSLLNLYMGYVSSDGSLQIKLFAKNVMDKQYLILASAQNVVPTGFVGAPRTFGVTLTKDL